ncbi:hypothetical protein [Chlamydia pecorum]|uniref:hypothetical protein n=2 Tax=Chlamydia pecorum TaxID=85991 RepID=UPI0003AD8A71|nr:hypothetical protein [Chlamydia pecorum]AGW40007.1 hypothetical protein CPE3_0679 [Chlamydia pecorum P787]ETF37181.1 hypothetical protein CpecG_0940 [Chlamydia pecorum MC/MarsBar]ETF37737.1 hypothetical protein CpecS_0936 [Chlamydia pecorum VR629]AGW39081.1 hypothetical protein CPE2_0679 [Chlamydia pecorum W73]ETF37329.1 hypothetical protein CpecF_0938 [Chlamydia pecorum DBDeUG]
MIKKFFVNIFILSSLFSSSMNLFGEEGIAQEKEVLLQEKEETGSSVAELDNLLQRFIGDGQELCDDLLALCKENSEDAQKILQVLSYLSSGKKLLETCQRIVSLVEPLEGVASQQLVIERVPYNEECSHHCHEKELNLRERELEFKKEVFAWKKDYADKRLSWEKEKYAHRTLFQE